MSCIGGDPGGVKKASTLTKGQKDLLNMITGTLKGEWGQPGDVYGGTTVAGIPDSMMQAFAQFGRLPGVAGQGIDTYSDMMNKFGSGWAGDQFNQAGSALKSGMADFDPNKVTENFNATVLPQAMRNWDLTQKGISERIANGDTSGRELSRAGREFNTDLAGQLNQRLFAGEEATKNRQMQGVPMAMQLASAPTTFGSRAAAMGSDLLGQSMNAANMQRQVGPEGTEGLMEKYNKWLQGQWYNNPALQFLGPALNTRAFENYYKQPEPGMFDSMMPGLGSLAGAGALGLFAGL